MVIWSYLSFYVRVAEENPHAAVNSFSVCSVEHRRATWAYERHLLILVCANNRLVPFQLHLLHKSPQSRSSRTRSLQALDPIRKKIIKNNSYNENKGSADVALSSFTHVLNFDENHQHYRRECYLKVDLPGHATHHLPRSHAGWRHQFGLPGTLHSYLPSQGLPRDEDY